MHTPNLTSTQFPWYLSLFIFAICVAPLALMLLGVDFGTHPVAFDFELAATRTHSQNIDAMFGQLSGAFIHTLLEWNAFTAAMFIAIVAITHYRMTGDITTPVIGIALFCSGCMDAFHTLAADRIIDAVAPNQDLIPFTWAICRIFNAIIMIIGILVVLKYSNLKNRDAKKDIQFILLVSLIFIFIAYLIVSYCASSENLPQTIFPDSLITRPWDIAPLILFLFAGFYLYPLFYKKHPSLFAYGLFISVIPEIATQLYMAFGSTALFDSSFNVAHFLKIIAYFVPFIGLLLDYIKTYQDQNQAVINLEASKQALKVRGAELLRSNKELENFAYIASHDLQEPLRKVQAFGDRLKTQYKDVLDDRGLDYLSRMQNAGERMSTLINDLLNFSRISTKAKEFSNTDLSKIVTSVANDLEISIKDKNAIIKTNNLPTIEADELQMRQLFQNIIGNALKFNKSDTSPNISITSRTYFTTSPNGVNREQCEIRIKDNGIGFEQQYQDKIFEVFQRLHSSSEYSGTGVGLAICRRIAERHDGEISATSMPNQGATFIVTLPTKLSNATQMIH